MIRPLPMRPALVMLAHGLDLLTLLLVAQMYPLAEGEWNAFTSGGLGPLILLKTAGAIALACLVVYRMDRWPWVHQFTLPLAVGAGIVGAEVNLISIVALRLS